MESTSIPRILDADQSFADLVSFHHHHLGDVIPPLTPRLCERTFYHDRNFGKEELKIWGEFPIEEQKKFIEEFGEFVDLMRIEINLDFLIALAHHWDPVHRVFSFDQVDLTPTVEEYTDLIQLILGRKWTTKIYIYDLRVSVAAQLSKCTGVSVKQWMDNLREHEGTSG